MLILNVIIGAVFLTALVSATFARYVAAWLDAHASAQDHRRRQFEAELQKRGLGKARE